MDKRAGRSSSPDPKCSKGRRRWLWPLHRISSRPMHLAGRMSKGKQSPGERQQKPLLPTASLTGALLHTVPSQVALQSVLPGLRREQAKHQTTAHPLLLQRAAAAALQTCKPCHQGGLLHPGILGRREKGGWTGQLWSITKDQSNSHHPHPCLGHSHSSLSARSSPAAGKCKSGGLLPNCLRHERLRCMCLCSTRNFSSPLKVCQSYSSSWSGTFSSQYLYW